MIFTISGNGRRSSDRRRETDERGAEENKVRRYKGSFFAAVIWLLLWQLLARSVSNPFLLAGPLETGRALGRMAVTASFWQALSASFLRMFGGFLAGTLLAFSAAALAYRKAGLRVLLSPFVLCVKSVPVASFIILILIWAGSRYVALWISAVICFPVVYLNTLSGLLATEQTLLETAALFRLRFRDRITALYLPQLRPFFGSALSVACGMSFKAGVAAEVIGQPLCSIGNGIYRAKIYLETADIFAWTAAVVLLSWLSERLVRRVLALL